MKKLLAALAITLGTAALAQSDANQNTRTQQQDERNDANRVDTGIEATDVLPGLSGSQAQKQAQKTPDNKQTDASLMNKANAFSLNGTLKKADMDGDGATIARAQQKLPDVELDVRDQTVVMLDGKKVALRDIPEGAQVRARFQIDRDDAVAVELNASTKGMSKKGTQSGNPGTQQTPQQ